MAVKGLQGCAGPLCSLSTKRSDYPQTVPVIISNQMPLEADTNTGLKPVNVSGNHSEMFSRIGLKRWRQFNQQLTGLILDNGRHIGDLVEEVELPLVEVFGWAGERAGDLLHHLLQQLAYVRCTERTSHCLTCVHLLCGVDLRVLRESESRQRGRKSHGLSGFLPHPGICWSSCSR